MEDIGLSCERELTAAIVIITGKLDGNTSKTFQQFLADNLAEDDLTVVFDATQLEFISSAGLREFMTLLKRLGKKNARPAIFGMVPGVALAMEIAGFDVLFERAKNRTAAINALTQSNSKRGGLLGRFIKSVTK